MDRIPAIRRVILADVSLAKGVTWSTVAVVVPTALRWVIDRGEAGIPFVTYFPAVVLASLLLGWRWGALVAVLSGVVANRLFTHEPILEVDPTDAILILLFALSCAALIGIAEMARRLVRELEDAKQRETLLNAELMHRVKNLLATVNAMAVLTARHSDPGQFSAAFTGRMRALDRVTEMLGVGQAAQCEVGKLVSTATEPFRASRNFEIGGADCELPRDACMPLALALHELCTNAVKHGALSAPDGKVSLTWDCDAHGLLTIDWREKDGPKVPDQRKPGMGTQLLRRQRGLKRVEVEFPPDGVTCRIEIDGVKTLAKAA